MTLDGSTQYVYAYDGNGNVSCVMNRSTGATVAEYEYGAFGDLLRASNTYAQTNPFRFSTQYADNETGLLYYGFRYYSPNVGRFICRDRVEENGGINLYAFCANNGVNNWDILGNQISRFQLSDGTWVEYNDNPYDSYCDDNGAPSDFDMLYGDTGDLSGLTQDNGFQLNDQFGDEADAAQAETKAYNEAHPSSSGSTAEASTSWPA